MAGAVKREREVQVEYYFEMVVDMEKRVLLKANGGSWNGPRARVLF